MGGVKLTGARERDNGDRELKQDLMKGWIILKSLEFNIKQISFDMLS